MTVVAAIAAARSSESAARRGSAWKFASAPSDSNSSTCTSANYGLDRPQARDHATAVVGQQVEHLVLVAFERFLLALVGEEQDAERDRHALNIASRPYDRRSKDRSRSE